jgi:hypothetical protein
MPTQHKPSLTAAQGDFTFQLVDHPRQHGPLRMVLVHCGEFGEEIGERLLECAQPLQELILKLPHTPEFSARGAARPGF